MLAKHSFFYLFARGIPGLINFAALAVYTRLLSPVEYGQYAVVIAIVGFMNMLFFEWIHLGLLRYLPTVQIAKEKFLSNIVAAYLMIALICIISALIFFLFYDQQMKGLIIPGLLVLLFTGLFNTNLQLQTAQLKPLQFGKLAAGKAVLGLVIGSSLVWYGLGAKGILYAVALAMGISILFWGRHEKLQFHPGHFDKGLMKKLLLYGLPLAVNLAMAEVISSSDRMFLLWMQGEATAGLYAVGYDLSSQVLGVILMIINLAAFPLAVRALEQEGKQAAEQQLKQNILMIAGIAFPAAAGLAILAPGITYFLLGEEFQLAAQKIIPWVALAALLAGLKSYYFDLAFQLGQHTLGQLKVLLIAVLVNVLLNFLLIPEYAEMGAIYATLIAYVIGLFLSILVGRKWFYLPFPSLEVVKIFAATLIMSSAIWPLRTSIGIEYLFIAVALGVVIYMLMIILLNVAGFRDRVIYQLLHRNVE